MKINYFFSKQLSHWRRKNNVIFTITNKTNFNSAQYGG